MIENGEITSKYRDAEIETIHGGFVTPYRLTNAPRKLSGCVYRADGSKVAASERVGGHRGDMVVSENSDTIAPPRWMKTLPGRGLYLGNFMAHYGHFQFECLSTAWILREFPAESFDYFLFHPFVFGTRIPDYARICLERLGIDPARIVFVGDEPLAVESLMVPRRLAQINRHSDVRMAWVYQRIADGGAAPAKIDFQRSTGRRVYVSRRLFALRNLQRMIANEVKVEEIFRRAGFEIVYPEAMTYPEQLALCQSTRVMAGMSGSNLFNVLFTRPGALLIELGDPRYSGEPNPCQIACNAIASADGRFIPFQGRVFGPRQTILFDTDYLLQELEALLRADLPTAAAALTPPGLSLSGLSETAYRSLRPSFGHLVRKLMPKPTLQRS